MRLLAPLSLFVHIVSGLDLARLTEMVFFLRVPQAMRSEPALRGLDLSTYLLSPMQRITRYPLLLKQILNYTEPGEDQQKLEWVKA